MKLLIKYIISGGTAAIVDLSILHYLDVRGFHHIVSVNIAFLIAFIVSFSFQKYWTFSDSKSYEVHKQLRDYFIVSVINVFLNNLIIQFIIKINLVSEIPILREIVWAQIISSAIIAVESFVIYRFFIFKKSTNNLNNGSNKKGILIITQKVDKDDSILGFFHDWIMEFSKQYNNVIVICLQKGNYDLPKNVEILSMEKDKNPNKFKYIYLLNKFAFENRNKYDYVFCHMSPLYVISGFVIWKILHKKISMWYVHRNVDLKLKIANLLSDYIFSSTKEGYRINTKKVKYLGQAILVNKFPYLKHKILDKNTNINILTVGRITKIKNLDYLINTIKILKDKNYNVNLNIIGEAKISSDIEYYNELKNQISKLGLNSNINFIGSVKYDELAHYYNINDIFVNLAPSGGQDKAVLEAMSSGIPTFVANTGFKDFYGEFASDMIFELNNVVSLSDKIVQYIDQDNQIQITEIINKNIIQKADLSILISNISNELK